MDDVQHLHAHAYSIQEPKGPKDMSIHKLAHNKYGCFETDVSSPLIPNHSHGLRSEGRHCQILVKSIESIGEPVQKLPYLYTYAYKFQTSLQSLKKRGQLYLIIVIIARERLDTFGSLNVSCLVDPACATSKPSWTACRET